MNPLSNCPWKSTHLELAQPYWNLEINILNMVGNVLKQKAKQYAYMNQIFLRT